MNRYLLRFNKTGYMRFISHLDLAKLFKRCIKRAEIPVAWSQGFNPHELASIVQPLSLGYESESEYYEMDTEKPIDMMEALKGLNKTTPDGVKFTAIKEIPVRHLSLSAATETAVYEAKVFVDFKDFRMDEYLNRPEIEIYKRDKKTKEMVPKDAKDQIKSLVFEGFFGENINKEIEDFALQNLDDRLYAKFKMEVACGSNNTLNPMNLLVSLYKFHNIDLSSEDVRIKRIDMLIGGQSAFDGFK